jgi:hypothetical protein
LRAPSQLGRLTLRCSTSRVLGIFVFALLFATPLRAQTITTTSPLPGGTVGNPYSRTFAASGCIIACTWSVTSGTLPGGLSLSSAGVLSGTPTTAVAASFSVRATSLGNDTKPFSLTIAPALAITTTTLPGTTVGVVYSQTVNRTGGTSPFTWSLPSGALPGGVTLNSVTGLISGTPTASGTFNFTVRVTDSAVTSGATANQALSIVVAPAVSITTASLPAGTAGAIYSQTLARSGGTTPFTWSLASGSLPTGLSLTPSTGAISGTPSAAGTFNFTAQVTDSVGATATRALSITINAPLNITTTSLPAGIQGNSYSTTLARTGGTSPFAWTVSSGSLPPPLSLNSGTGAITGTPSTAGTFTFTVLVTDAVGATDSQSLAILITTPLNITTTSLPEGVTTIGYSAAVNRTGGTGPFTWSITAGSLPTGLNLNSAGTITGTPSAVGTFSFTVRVEDSLGLTDTQALSIKIVAKLVITTTTLPQGTVNTSYTTTLPATGGTTPYTWSIVTGSLPAGLSLNGSSGVISGTPNQAETTNFLIRVTDSGSPAQTADQPLSIAIIPGLVITANSPLQTGMVGVSYSQALTATGGTTPYNWAVTAGALPGGLGLVPSTGVISGTPTAAGTFNFTVRLTDSAASAAVTKAFSVVIDPFPVVIPPLTISNSGALTPGTLGVQYSQSLNATGGVLPYAWVITAGAIPNGLTLTSAGILSGTPTVAGTFSFTVRVTDSSGPAQTATKSLSLTIVSALAILTSALPPATAGTAYSTTLSPAGGTLPYTWALAAGSPPLPSGLTLNPSTGVISGTAVTATSVSVTIRLTDSQLPPPPLTTTKVFAMVVQLPQIDTNIPATLNPAQQLPLTMSLRSSYPTALSGQLTLSFSGNGALPNDPMIQFSNGTRTAAFTFAANSTNAVFNPPVSLLTGTVAGAITLTASFQGGPPNQQAGPTSSIPLNAPQITSVVASQSGANMTVRIVGYSTPRSVTNLTFGFDVRTPAGVERVDVTRTGDPDFPTWYQDLQSIPFGSTFVFSQNFTVQSNGEATIEAVTVTLTNAQGSSSSNRTLLTHQ